MEIKVCAYLNVTKDLINIFTSSNVAGIHLLHLFTLVAFTSILQLSF